MLEILHKIPVSRRRLLQASRSLICVHLDEHGVGSREACVGVREFFDGETKRFCLDLPDFHG